MRVFPIILGIHLIAASIISIFHLILFESHLAVTLIVGIPILIFGVILLFVGTLTSKPARMGKKGDASWE